MHAGNNIGDDGIAALAPAFASLELVEELNLGSTFVYVLVYAFVFVYVFMCFGNGCLAPINQIVISS